MHITYKTVLFSILPVHLQTHSNHIKQGFGGVSITIPPSVLITFQGLLDQTAAIQQLDLQRTQTLNLTKTITTPNRRLHSTERNHALRLRSTCLSRPSSRCWVDHPPPRDPAALAKDRQPSSLLALFAQSDSGLLHQPQADVAQCIPAHSSRPRYRSRHDGIRRGSFDGLFRSQVVETGLGGRCEVRVLK